MRNIFIISTLNDGVKEAIDVENTTMGNMGISLGSFKICILNWPPR